MMKFTATHEWLTPENDNMIIGITHHAQQLLGDLVFVELPEIGLAVRAGDALGVVESVKAASDFYAPISGTVIAINEAVQKDASIVNQFPEQAGWLFKLKADNPNEITALLDAEQYGQHIAEDH